MTIDEAIELVKIERECVIRADVCDRKCEKCDLLQDSAGLTDMYEQLVAWLEELKDYRDKNKMVVRVDVENMDSVKDKIEELSKYAESQYNKAIDDFAEILIRYVDCGHLCSPTEERWSDLSVVKMVEELAEQLKVGGENDNLRR